MLVGRIGPVSNRGEFMPRKPEPGSASCSPRPLPREITARGLWQNPVFITALFALLIPVFLLIRAVQFQLGGWRSEARSDVNHLYSILQNQGPSRVQPGLLKDGYAEDDLTSLDRRFGHVRSYLVSDLDASGPYEETVEVSVDRSRSGKALEVIKVDSNGLIISAARLHQGPEPTNTSH
jgi:hypothetical protein